MVFYKSYKTENIVGRLLIKAVCQYTCACLTIKLYCLKRTASPYSINYA